ncbi:hypothetical protein MMC07_006802 [Pseudocyphellaria aurata]|nr:hypothetical protein [Pseudocyphellaria aurata]
MGRLIFLKLTTVYLMSFSAPSATALLAALDGAKVMGLVPRAATSCSASNSQPCSQMPAGFCCPSGSTCMIFNDGASVVCCPSGKDCKTIAPLTCDITQQNATLHPENPLHSTDLGGSLEKCGSACCPKGFACQNQQCIIKASSSSSSAAATTSKPSASSATPTSAPSSASSSKAPSQIPTSSASQQQPAKNGTADAACDKFPAAAILAGFFPGLLLGILLTVLAIICIGRRRRSRHTSSDFGSVAATVSDPIYQPENNAFRTDFLRRGSQSKNQTSRVKSLFSRSPTIDGTGRNISGPIRTPEMRKEPSTESIKIYSPPNGGLMDRPSTTFAEMMVDAGFEPGKPFLQSPARIYPKGKGPGEA